MEKDFIDLFEFQTKLKEGVESLFPKRLWIKAEISAIKARSGGHCYLELCQSGPEGLLAKANAVVWSSRYRIISPYFESVTGSPMKEGMTVLLQVQVSYSQLYGFTLVVQDVDPEYSLGLRELERQKTIERLRREGIIDMQQGLEFPQLPRRLAVISAPDAAGYRDFMRHIEENPYGFRFVTDLFPTLMQGADCPASVMAALDSVIASGTVYDAVLILRGGGSRLDLSCFDDYALAAAIAQYPLPVVTAIGHDQDHHVCDMTAHRFVKTPTALADFILEIYEDEDARLLAFETRMKLAFVARLASMEAAADSLWSRVRSAALVRLSEAEYRLQTFQGRIEAADPKCILERGYVLAVDASGVVVKTAGKVSVGDKVMLMFADGVIGCRVEDVRKEKR